MIFTRWVGACAGTVLLAAAGCADDGGGSGGTGSTTGGTSVTLQAAQRYAKVALELFMRATATC